MDEIIVRTAVEEDLQTLLEFEQGVISAERPFDPTLKPGKINYYDLKEMMENPDVELMVALSGNEIVGSGYARIEDVKNYLQHPQHAYLGFMYVKPECRGKGVNQKIIEGLKQWSLKRGLKEMRLDVYEENIPAIKAYERVGFSKHLIEMRLGIGE
ncbi:MAG: GNAT family N-acetyltransferase [Bacteroidota bacterium]|nr:GNAT family N-acetyltransferase [Bacteroidota bacterium]